MGRRNQPGEPREKERQREWDGGRAGVRREMARERTQRGVSIVLAKCGLEAWYRVDPLDVTVRMGDLFS